MSKTIGGIVPVIPTPFRSDDSIHEQDLRRVVRFVGDHGAGGMCTPAYGSEFYKLTDKERDHVVSVVIEANAGRVPVVAQANHGSASVAASTAKLYERMGADLISVAVPRMFALRSADVLRYLGRVADALRSEPAARRPPQPNTKRSPTCRRHSGAGVCRPEGQQQRTNRSSRTDAASR